MLRRAFNGTVIYYYHYLLLYYLLPVCSKTKYTTTAVVGLCVISCTRTLSSTAANSQAPVSIAVI